MKKETVDTQPNSTHMNQVGSMGLTNFFFFNYYYYTIEH